MQIEQSKSGVELMKKRGEWVAILYFAFLHYVFEIVLIFIAMPGLFSYWYSLVIMTIYILCTFKYSSSYYIHYFSKNYLAKLEELNQIENDYLKDEKSEQNVATDKKNN